MKASKRVCVVDECVRLVHARDWCGTHYERWRLLGTTEKTLRSPRICAVDDCTERVFCHNFCPTHYGRWRRYGAPERLPLRLTVSERFRALYDVIDTGCWIWRGTPGANGYGRLSIGNRPTYAHRAAYELHVGPIPAGLTIDHLCRVRMCVNPDHLEPVTRAENTRREAAALRRTA